MPPFHPSNLDFSRVVEVQARITISGKGDCGEGRGPSNIAKKKKINIKESSADPLLFLKATWPTIHREFDG